MAQAQTVQEREAVAKEIRTSARHGAIYGLGAVLVKVLGFLMLPVYTHYLNPRDYGILEILDLSMSLLGMFLNMGMTAAMLRYYAAAETASEKRKVVSTSLLFVVATGLIMFLLAVGFVRPVSALLFGPKVPSSYLLISVSSFILAYVANLPRTYLRALEASGTFIFLDTISVFVMLVLNVAFVAVFKIGLSGILLSALLVNVAWITVSAWVFRQVGSGFSAAALRKMLAFGLPLIFSNLAMFALNFSDRFFLRYFRSLEVVGIYAVGYKFGFMVSFLLVQPFYGMWQARMYIIQARPDHHKIFLQIFVLYSLVLIYAALAISLLSSEVVRAMVDPKFSSSQEVIPIIALAYVFYGLGYYVQLGMFLTNRTKTIGLLSAATGILNLGLNYLLIAHNGMIGAAWATLISFAAIAAGSYLLSQRVYPLRLGLGRVATLMALAICIYVSSKWWHANTLTTDLLLKGFLLVAFPVVVWKGRLLSNDETSTLFSAWESFAAKAFHRQEKGVSL